MSASHLRRGSGSVSTLPNAPSRSAENAPALHGARMRRLCGLFAAAAGLAAHVDPAAADSYKYSVNPSLLGWSATPGGACDAEANAFNSANGANATSPNHQFIASHSLQSGGTVCLVMYYYDTDPNRTTYPQSYPITQQACSSDCPSPPPPPPPPPIVAPPISQADCATMPNMKWNSAQAICAHVTDEYRANNVPRACSKVPDSPPADGVANPIYPATGTKRESVFTLLHLGSLSLKLTYDSSRRAVAGWSPSADAPSFGPLWFSSFHRSMGDGGAHRGDGRVANVPGLRNTNETGGSWLGGFFLKDIAGRELETYDPSGRITTLTYANGETFTFAHSDSSTPATVAPAPGYLIQASDAFGRTIKFEYRLPAGGNPATDGRVSKIIDPAGQAALVSYDTTTGNLKQISWADGRSRQFVYENTSFPWALTGVIDERGIRYSTFGYDAQGNAVSSEHAGGVDRYSVSSFTAPRAVINEVYDAARNVYFELHDWEVSANPVLTLPNGSTANLSVNTIQGYPRITSRSQPAGSGCLAATSQITFDTFGNPTVVSDFNGNQTLSEFDGYRDLEVTRTEGVPPPGVNTSPGSAPRRLRMVWHPDWPLRVQLIEPKKMTYWIYNGQPDPFTGGIAWCAPSTARLVGTGSPIVVLCKKVEQATRDESGSSLYPTYAMYVGMPARTWQWTYNQYGQVLSATDPLNNTTTYTYYTDTTADHTMGDLQTATNPVGQAVQYVKYDKLGHLMRSIDPNGATVDMAYTPRGWLSSVTVTPASGTALTTLIGHNEVGQVNSVQLPDGTSLTYGYDDAQRLTSITDAAGNTVTYTLDNAGNRKSEQLKDASGTLVRSITRAYDALNRLQSVTGAAQ